MSCAAANRRLFEDKPKPIRLRWVVLIFVVALVPSHYLAFFVGGWLEPKEIRIVRQAPPVAAPASALTQWACTKQERREYDNACWRRKLSAATKEIR